MGKYESVSLFKESTTQDEIDAVVEKVRQTAKANSGEVTGIEPWGKRELAYTMNGHRAAHYLLLRMSGTGQTVKEVERIFKLDERVIRFLTVVAEEPSKAAGKIKGATHVKS